MLRIQVIDVSVVNDIHITSFLKFYRHKKAYLSIIAHMLKIVNMVIKIPLSGGIFRRDFRVCV